MHRVQCCELLCVLCCGRASAQCNSVPALFGAVPPCAPLCSGGGCRPRVLCPLADRVGRSVRVLACFGLNLACACAQGGLPFVGDVAIKGDKILAVGPNLKITGTEEIDATGKHLMPGWTDVHSHMDAQCMWDPLLQPSAAGGVTTVVMGNCGVSAAPCRKEHRDFMLHLLEGVEVPCLSLEQSSQPTHRTG